MSDYFNSWAWPWWSVVVVINIVQLAVCFVYVRKHKESSFRNPDKYLRIMMIAGIIFTVVAAYRSVFVSRYLTQLAWFDTLANSSLLIRSFAFFAELSFAVLFAMALLRFEKDLPKLTKPKAIYGLLTKGPYVIVVCIFIAQFFAYGGLIFKSRLSFAIEETLWSAGFIAILPLAIIHAKRAWQNRADAQLRSLVISSYVIAAWCVVYCTYSLAFHLPLEYWGTAIDQIHTNVPPLKYGWSAVADSFKFVNVTYEYSDWGFGFLLWHSAYFTICVWIALVLMRAPRKLEA